VTAYRLISAEKARTPVSISCRLLGVSHSGYYEWAANVPSERARVDAELIERIVEIHAANRGPDLREQPPPDLSTPAKSRRAWPLPRPEAGDAGVTQGPGGR
jgi:hypothetical protein